MERQLKQADEKALGNKIERIDWRALFKTLVKYNCCVVQNRIKKKWIIHKYRDIRVRPFHLSLSFCFTPNTPNTRNFIFYLLHRREYSSGRNAIVKYPDAHRNNNERNEASITNRALNLFFDIRA